MRIAGLQRLIRAGRDEHARIRTKPTCDVRDAVLLRQEAGIRRRARDPAT
jgi:hypothetical protein